MYVDPNAPMPDTQPTRPSSAVPLGPAGMGLPDLIEAATAGSLRVDDTTGAATLRAIDAVRERIDQLTRLTSAGGRTRLGGGYAEQVDRFNQEWSADGEDSAAARVRAFGRELAVLREAVVRSMATYRATDEAGVDHLRRTGA